MASWVDAVHAAAVGNYACNDPGLAARTVAFVVDGAEPGDLLTAIWHAGRTIAAQHAVQTTIRTTGEHPNWGVYIRFGEMPTVAALRFAQLPTYATLWRAPPKTMVDVAGMPFFETLLCDIAWSKPRSRQGATVPVGYPTLEAMVRGSGGQPGELLTAAFRPPPDVNEHRVEARTALAALDGYAAAAEQFSAQLAPLAVQTPRWAQPGLLALLNPLSATQLGLFSDGLAACVTSDSTTVSLTAAPLARRCAPSPLLAALKVIAQQGDPSSRARAVRAVHTLAGDPVEQKWAADTAASDRAPGVRALATELSVLEERPSGQALPPDEISWRVDVTPALTAALARLFDDVATVGAVLRERHPRWDGSPPALTEADWKHVVAQLKSGTAPKAGRRIGFPSPEYTAAIETFVSDPSTDATAALIVLHSFDWLFGGQAGELSGLAVTVVKACFATAARPTLVELAARIDGLGRPGPNVVWSSYRRNGLAKTWPPEAVWPFVSANLDTVLAELVDTNRWTDGVAPFRALSTLPQLPTVAVHQLFTLALGAGAEKRRLAQGVLGTVADLVPRVVVALSDGKADVRAVAARWLGDIGDTTAVPALESALGVERNDVAKGALLDGLSALGRSPSEYLDAATLAEQAHRGVRGAPPKALAWLDLDTVPALRWTDGGDVAPVVAHYLLTLAVKGKSPEPDALMRHYCRLLQPDDRARLASFVLDSWISADDRYHSGSTHARRVSVIGAKGILAVVAACADADAVAGAHAFIYRHYGTRAAQCRALLAMLSWTDRPEAVQTLLAVATRFRTKGIREEAENQVNALAQRRGWSPAELADRTAPDGGFDADGVLRLDYAPGNAERRFTATIQPDLTLVLRSSEHKVIKALPAPRQADDQASAAAAKKALAAARKLLKSAAAAHTERLYAAMCSQRAWRFADWQTYLQRHPVVGQLTRRLVWVADDGLATTVLFRPLDDGSLTDVDDNEITLSPEAVVRLAHSLTVPKEQLPPWRQHFTDYEVTALFDQFREPYSPPPAAARTTSIDDFVGHTMPYFTFRAAASPLGYTLGTAIDGPEVYDYRKSLPTIGITVELGFSGISVTQPNDSVELQGAHFVLSDAEASTQLGDLPAVLVSEVYNDLRQIAAVAQPAESVGATRQTGPR